jgi:hypothetical protein
VGLASGLTLTDSGSWAVSSPSHPTGYPRIELRAEPNLPVERLERLERLMTGPP